MRHFIFSGLIFLSLIAASFASEPPTIVPIDNDGIQRIEMVGAEYYFKPAHVVVKVNVPVELKVRKEAYIVPHDIVIDAPEAGIKVSESLSRDPKTISFTPTRIGKFPIFCSKKPPFMSSHREKGMEGMLEVVE